MQRCAVTTFEAVGASGLGRVDFFLTAQGQVYVNEINTMPGFTSISMYPKLWEASGVSYAALLDRLVAIALRRMKARKEKRLF